MCKDVFIDHVKNKKNKKPTMKNGSVQSSFYSSSLSQTLLKNVLSWIFYISETQYAKWFQLCNFTSPSSACLISSFYDSLSSSLK